MLQKDIKKRFVNLDFLDSIAFYYQVFKDDSRNNYQDTKVVTDNISFDKEKLHELFFKNSNFIFRNFGQGDIFTSNIKR